MKRTRPALIVTALALSLGAAACSGTAAPSRHPSSAAASASGAAASAAAAVRKPAPKPVVGVDPSPTSDSVVASSSRTPTMADLAALTSIARSRGLRVEYRVLYAIGNSDSRNESIQPRSLTAWLRSLLAAETSALELAQRDHVSEFVAGTEMASIDQSPLWGGFFAKAARLYHGILSYASWGGQSGFGGFFSSQRVPLPLRYFGASAYPPVNLPATASVAQLTKAWVEFLRRAPESVLRLTAVLSADPASAPSSLEGFEGHPATEAAIRSCP